MLLGIVLTVLLQGDITYKVKPVRIDQDLYKDLYSNLLMKTELCIGISLGDGVLIDGGPLYRKLIFSDNKECIVRAVYKSN